MLPLQGSTFAESLDALRQSIKGGFDRLRLSTRELIVEGAAFPQLERVAVDLSGANVTKETPRLKPGPARTAQLPVRSFSLVAKPLLVNGLPVQFHLEASDAVLREHAAEQVDRLLALDSAASGHLSIQIRQDDLQKLALLIAQEAASQKGLQVQELQLTLTAESQRSLALKASVTAKFGFIKAALELTGQATLDEALQLHLTNLDVTGSGMAASMATAFVKPQLAKLSQNPIPLSALSLGEIKLRDVRVSTGEHLRIEAEFGG